MRSLILSSVLEVVEVVEVVGVAEEEEEVIEDDVSDALDIDIEDSWKGSFRNSRLVDPPAPPAPAAAADDAATLPSLNL